MYIHLHVHIEKHPTVQGRQTQYWPVATRKQHTTWEGVASHIAIAFLLLSLSMLRLLLTADSFADCFY